ncbi:ATP-binding cassette domain-containing protein [Streptococcus sp.]|uniref:ABC transporter ATP-binding protein n=1 Tax=Streptococcus sp. TaxID=1306 RepID=UPI0035A0B760
MKIFELDNLGLVSPEKIILEEISLSIEKGEHLTITGPSGSGKSSLLKVLAGLVSPSSGRLFYQGQDLEDLDPVSYRREVSYCFQQPVLFGQTVRDNMAFPFEIRQILFDQEKVLAALARLDLGPEFLEKPIKELSGGEKQRVALVRNLLFEPKVLLLDEVSSGLDEKTKTLLRTFLNDLHQAGVTLIEVTHDQREIEEAEHLVTIVEGRLAHE